jgi:hypothetical protein
LKRAEDNPIIPVRKPANLETITYSCVIVWATPQAKEEIVKMIRATIKAVRLPSMSPQRAKTTRKPAERTFSQDFYLKVAKDWRFHEPLYDIKYAVTTQTDLLYCPKSDDIAVRAVPTMSCSNEESRSARKSL